MNEPMEKVITELVHILSRDSFLGHLLRRKICLILNARRSFYMPLQ